MLGLEDPKTGLWKAEELAGILAHQLRAPLTAAPAQPPGRTHLTGAQTFGKVLGSECPLLSDLRRIKNFGKENREGKRVGLPPEVATVIYYAAIAAAFLSGQREITKLSDEACAEGFDWSLSQRWIDPSIRTLLEHARTRHAIVGD